jgi:hypothetical protein
MPKAPIFISYSRTDTAFAVRLADDLRASGLKVWIDQRDIGVGKRWDMEIEKALEKAAAVVLLLSPRSVSSDNVRDELSYSLDSGKRVVPIMVETCRLPMRISSNQYIDFTKDYKKGVSALVDTLGKKVTSAPAIVAGSDPAPKTKPWMWLLVLGGAFGLFLLLNGWEKNADWNDLQQGFNTAWKAQDYGKAFNKAGLMVTQADKEHMPEALINRGRAYIMLGRTRGYGRDSLLSGIADINRAEQEYGENTAQGNYYKAIASNAIEEYTTTINCINAVFIGAASKEPFDELPDYGVYKLRGIAYHQMMNDQAACADLRNGKERREPGAAELLQQFGCGY